MVSFGQTLREKRKSLKLSQQELTKKAGIARQTVTMLEHNQIQRPASQMVINLARVLELDTNTLFGTLPDPVMPFEQGGAAKREILGKLEKMEAELHEITNAVRQL